MNRQQELEAKNEFELNCLVAEARGLHIKDEQDSISPWPYVVTGFHGEPTLSFDYCNNPSDIMPIAIESRIDLEFIGFSGSTADASVYIWNGGDIERSFVSTNKNPYRAICIVFLLMRVVKNEHKNN